MGISEESRAVMMQEIESHFPEARNDSYLNLRLQLFYTAASLNVIGEMKRRFAKGDRNDLHSTIS